MINYTGIDLNLSMASAFTTILIPVDFTINTEVAIKKAIDLALPGSTTIHLFHVENGSSFHYSDYIRIRSSRPNLSIAPDRKLQQWKEMIEGTLPGVSVCCWIARESNIQLSVIAKAKRLQADLVIIGKTSHHNWLPFLNTIDPNEISEHTGSAVLMVKPGSLHNQIRTIIVPVKEAIPKKKMEILSTLCKKQRLRVHLVCFTRGNDVGQSSATLIQLYQWLKTVLQCPVEHAVLHGSNHPKALLAYAEKINADTLLLQQEAETRIGWPNRQISDILPSYSKVQVLTVQPPIESLT